MIGEVETNGKAMVKVLKDKKKEVKEFRALLKGNGEDLKAGCIRLVEKNKPWKRQCKELYKTAALIRDKARKLKFEKVRALSQKVAKAFKQYAARKRAPRSEEYSLLLKEIERLLRFGHKECDKILGVERKSPKPKKVEVRECKEKTIYKELLSEDKDDSELVPKPEAKILVVSDTERIRDEIEGYLEDQPFDSDYVGSILEAVGYIGRKYYDLIIFDSELKEGKASD
ncbi:MAG: response regulator, partial [Candidatus Dadabacteria bacterium]